MKYILLLAFKNVLRYRRRTVLTFSILTFGIMVYVLVTGILQGFDDQSFKNQINFETSDFKIRSLSFDEDNPYSISNYMNNYSAVEDILNKKDYILHYTPFIEFIGSLDNGNVDRPIIAIGIDPQTIDSVFTFSNFIYSGGFTEGGAVLGKNVASDMNLSIGDQIYVTFKNAQDAYDSVELTVSGLIDSPDPSVNSSTVYINIEDARSAVNSEGITELAVKSADYRKYRTYEADLSKSLVGCRIYDWNRLGQGFMAVGKAKKQSMNFFLFFIGIIALVGIINTLLMSVYEKRREIGMLKALGMTDRDVIAMFVFEGFSIGFLGSITGIIAGIAANIYFVIEGINITGLTGNIDIGWKVMGVVRSEWDIASMAAAFIVSITVSVAASFYPSWKTLKMQPAECLRVI